MPLMYWTELTSQPEISPLNDVAERNIRAIVVTDDVFHEERSLLNTALERNISLISVTEPTSHHEMSWLKSVCSKIPTILVTLPTFQPVMLMLEVV